MAYWLCITTEENWNVIWQKNVWGVQEKHRNTIAQGMAARTNSCYTESSMMWICFNCGVGIDKE